MYRGDSLRGIHKMVNSFFGGLMAFIRLPTRFISGCAFALGFGVLLSLQAFAHHSVSGQFDVSKKVVLTGTVEKVDWVNPHIYVHLKVTDPQAQAGVWELGTVPVAMARKAGITKESLLAAGQTVKVTAYPSRDGTQRMGFLIRVE